MTKRNVELRLNTITVVNRCATFLHHLKPCYVHDIMWPESLVKRISSGTIGELLSEG
jgi:hypothetical protein